MKIDRRDFTRLTGGLLLGLGGALARPTPAAAGAPTAGLSAASRPSCAAVIPCEFRKTL